MKLYEMEGFLRGKCVPGDMLVNETDAQYLVRKFTELNDRIEVTTAALREKTKQCDAEHNDVLVWEKTMFKACGEDGPKSVADKFAAMEAKCASLAAENAGLKSFGDKLAEMHNDLNGEGTGIQGRAEVACQQVALEAAMEEFDAIKTPDTDAFLREVRAEAILFASYHLPDGGKYQDSIQALAQEVLDGYTQVSFPVQQQRQGGAA
ncbi:hypothetical protein QMT05_03180 [Cronobacter malonaticus]|uniref:hypothetical protein n=1 Tax=Cronobacter malonaticus TaxID=413503 RepID=UPI0024C2EF18|nr:hypothetical protein [Cronobacter malonaticus]MDK1175878.1 hypothetical protein [Cronobacter malonaticus]MDK1685991.1 hypothetical protein [Cronobacter malonaticus]